MPDVHNTLYELVPADGSAIGNQSRKERLTSTVKGAREVAFDKARDTVFEQGKLAKGKGRGGSVRWTERHNGEQSRYKPTPSHRATHG